MADTAGELLGTSLFFLVLGSGLLLGNRQLGALMRIIYGERLMAASGFKPGKGVATGR